MYFNILLWLILLIQLPGTISHAQETRATETYQNYTILFSPDDRNNAQIIKDLLIRYSEKLENFYQVRPSSSVTILISESQEAFLKSHSRIPGWAAAVYIPAQKAIVLKSPAAVGSLPQLENDFLHELSHLYFDEKFAGREIPLWYNEGLAKYLSGERLGMLDGLDIGNAITSGQIIPLPSINKLVTFGKYKAKLAYLQSLSAVDYLKSHFSATEGWQRFHQSVVNDGWEAALDKHTGQNEFSFEKAWLANLSDEYRWMVIFNLDNFLWVSMAGIVLVGFVLARIRNRKKMREWEKNEGEWTDF